MKQKSSGGSAPRRGRPRRAVAGEAATPYLTETSGARVEERLDALINLLGNNRVADLLGVSASQPSRWRSGKEGIRPDNRRRILDLEYVMARLLDLMPLDQVEIWLRSFNPHLMTRPVDAFKWDGLPGIALALDAEEQGFYV